MAWLECLLCLVFVEPEVVAVCELEWGVGVESNMVMAGMLAGNAGEFQKGSRYEDLARGSMGMDARGKYLYRAPLKKNTGLQAEGKSNSRSVREAVKARLGVSRSIQVHVQRWKTMYGTPPDNSQ